MHPSFSTFLRRIFAKESNSRAGSAVYIYGINLVSSANITFSTDDGTSAFHYYSGSMQFVYKSLFSALNLPLGVVHTVSWVLHSTQNGDTGLFDYAVITVDVSTISSSTCVPDILLSSEM